MDTRERLSTAARAGFALSGIVAGIGLIGMGSSDGVQLGAHGLSGWAAVFASGFFGLLVSLPFGLQAIRLGRRADTSISWEWALTAWAAITAGVLVGGFALAIGTGISGAGAAGAAGIIIAIEASLVIAVLGSWILFGG